MIDEFTNINNESETFIYNYFAKLEKEIDVKREILIEEINKISDNMIDEIKVQREEIQTYHKNRTKIQACDMEQMNKFKIELDKYNKELKENLIDLIKWKTLRTVTEQKLEELTIKIENLTNESIGNKPIKFHDGNMKIDSRDLIDEIKIEDTRNEVIYMVWFELNDLLINNHINA